MSARVSSFVAGVFICLTTTAGLAEQPAAAASADRRDVSRDVWTAVTRYPHFTIFDDVSVAARGGRVILSGKVTNERKRQSIAERVSSVRGVHEVRNQLGVFPSSPSDNRLREQIARAIYGNAGFWHYAMLPRPSIHIIVEASHVTLRGVVRTDLDRSMAQALALQCDVLSVTNELKTNRDVGDFPDGDQ